MVEVSFRWPVVVGCGCQRGGRKITLDFLAMETLILDWWWGVVAVSEEKEGLSRFSCNGGFEFRLWVVCKSLVLLFATLQSLNWKIS